MKKHLFIIMISWLIASIYFGTGTLVYENAKESVTLKRLAPFDPTDTVSIANFENRRALELDLLVQQVDRWEKVFVWNALFPTVVNLLIGSGSFCVIGCITGLLIRRIFEEKEITLRDVTLLPALALITAFILLALSYVVPAFLVQGSTTIRPMSLLLLSTLIGLYMKEFYFKLSEYFKSKMLKQ